MQRKAFVWNYKIRADGASLHLAYGSSNALEGVTLSCCFGLKNIFIPLEDANIQENQKILRCQISTLKDMTSQCGSLLQGV